MWALVTLALAGLCSASEMDSSRRHRAECLMWSKLENKTLPLQNQGHANCTTNKDCTGFECKGMYKEQELTFGMRVRPCEPTPGVEIHGFAPQFNAQQFSHVFYDKSTYKVPGGLFNLSMIPDAAAITKGSVGNGANEVSGRLQVHVTKNPGGKSLMVGLVLQGFINKTVIFSKPVFNHTEIPVPECTNKADGKNAVVRAKSAVCSMRALNVCGPNQVCVQEEGDTGICQCRRGFAVQEDGSCISASDDEKLAARPLPPSKPVDNAIDAEAKMEGESEATNDKPRSAEPSASEEAAGSSSSAAVTTGVVVGLLLVLVAGGAVAYFVVMHTRLAPRLRARVTRKPYGDIMMPGGSGGSPTRSQSTQDVMA